jgi:hypothetical protein
MPRNLRYCGTLLLVAALAPLGLTAPPAAAVNADHGDRVVSADPAAFTPHVMNGSVDAITQVGSRIIAAGTFTSVSPAGTVDDTADDLVRNRIFAFDATTGAIDTSFDPNLGGAVKSLDTDGTYIYAVGLFESVGGNDAIKRVVKLTAGGAVVSAFQAVPNSRVNEVVVRGSRVYIGGGFTGVRSGGVTSSRRAVAALDRTTGAVLAGVNVPFTGVYDPNNGGGGSTNIKRFDVSPDGSRLVAVGNFATVGGQPRVQLAVLDTSGATATVASWSTNRYDRAHNSCARAFDTFMRDVDFSPDGSYFVVTTTGAFAGGAGSGTLCDTVARWATPRPGTTPGNNPTWVDYTGGDTVFGVAVTGSAVYVGGHMRWFNNPFQGNQAGPGAVPRRGIAALDPVNGLPLPWNPGRSRGVGAQALLATSQGLWVGSDTTRIGGETHGRVALMPLSGGTSVPSVPAATLPNDLFVAQRTSPGVLQRRAVGATGAPIGSPSTADATMDWATVRGAFLLDGTVYFGLSDGALYKRTFDPSTGAVGAQQVVDLRDDPETGERIPFAIATMTGMFYDTATHRIYYTVLGDSRLHFRHFTPQGEVVGARRLPANANGVSFASAAGMTLASGRILYGSSTDGALRSVSFSGGQVTGSPAVVSSDGTWNYRAIFVPNT